MPLTRSMRRMLLKPNASSSRRSRRSLLSADWTIVTSPPFWARQYPQKQFVQYIKAQYGRVKLRRTKKCMCPFLGHPVSVCMYTCACSRKCQSGLLDRQTRYWSPIPILYTWAWGRHTDFVDVTNADATHMPNQPSYSPFSGRPFNGLYITTIIIIAQFLRLNLIKYWPMFKLISLSESGEHLS